MQLRMPSRGPVGAHLPGPQASGVRRHREHPATRLLGRQTSTTLAGLRMPWGSRATLIVRIMSTASRPNCCSR